MTEFVPLIPCKYLIIIIPQSRKPKARKFRLPEWCSINKHVEPLVNYYKFEL